MAGSSAEKPNPELSTKQRRAARSVSGCLTCRRRRVKCTTHGTPCSNCTRLHLTCTPSFNSNFKNWTPNTASSGEDTRQVSGEAESGFIPVEGKPESPKRGQESAINLDFQPEETEMPSEIAQWLSGSLSEGPFYDLEAGNALNNSTWPTTGESENSASILDGNALFNSMMASSPVDLDFLSLPQQVSMVYGNSHGDLPLLHRYETNMPNLLTSKASPWNPYRYMLNSTQDTPDSPLRHGILSWTCSYISCREQNQAYSGATYYVSASNSITSLVQELSSIPISLVPTRRNAKIAEKLYMLLSTAFFLCQCDMILCDYSSMQNRLDSIKDLFERHWIHLSLSLGSLESRLLIWLAYLDLRSSLFCKRKRPLESRLGNHDLLHALVKLNAFPSLRAYPEGESYLSESFGGSYPREEIEEDLIQEPCHIKCDDILSVFSSLSAFESWNDAVVRHGIEDPMIEELRTAKIDVLRANIARIRAECIVLFRSSYQEKVNALDRTTFHALTVTALHLSATIMLNRIILPNIRTDPESQACAHELIHISHRLRRAKYLQTPRSLIWPLPIFIAAIEIEDVVYQDWCVGYMVELEGWGMNVRRTRELLERVLERQERGGRRVRVRDVMEDFGGAVII
ncbi:hypothetical protein N431DRAFT_370819 [Stipitochalara longipes BDJ]|nr:hypothetical protein N431DRAFT_370819 [Stipitochalara longipes BDJ]